MAVISWIQLGLLSSALAFAHYPPTGSVLAPRLGPKMPLSIETLEGTDVSSCERRNTNVPPGSLVDQLWQANCDLVEKFLGNKFVLAQARQEPGRLQETFQSFQYYSVQDYYYLLETVPHEAFVMKTKPPVPMPALRSDINEIIKSMNDSLDYVDSLRTNLTNPEKFNISENTIDTGSLRTVGLGYVHWLKGNTELGWFGHGVSQIPCYYGWGEIATFLNGTSLIASLFFEQWIEPNLDFASGTKISEDLEPWKDLYVNNETFAHYNQLFREAIQFEIAFFESAMNRTLADVCDGICVNV
ncbi:hypothetical protein F5B19DRAFT_498647 [Rostrohypoxylon terebratum]|nr:hypothetical protein F5B19DRAFT_498647 [Rostrohypoxylon terebratum]